MRYLACALLAGAVLAAPASAQTRSKVVAAGQTSVIDTQTLFSRTTCKTQPPPRMSLDRKPRHGRVDFRRARMTIQNSNSNCDGRRALGMQVLYTPNPGFRGQDTFVVRFRNPAGGLVRVRGPKTQSFAVTVR